MSGLNSLPQSVLVVPIDGTAANPPITFGGGLTGSSGTGIYGDSAQVKFTVAGSAVATINASGISATITGNATTATTATNLAGGSGGTIPYQSAAGTTAMLANGTAGQLLKSNGTTSAPSYVSLSALIVVLTSAAGAGGGATEAMTVTGLTTSDVIISVTQKTPGANSLPLLGYSTQATNALTAIFSADPGAGAVIVVTVRR